MGWMESDGENDFASIFASVAQEKRERAERQQTEMMLRVLDEMDAKAAAPAKRREMQQGSLGNEDRKPVWTKEDEEDFRAFQAFRRARMERQKEFMRGEDDDEMLERHRKKQTQEKAARAEKVRKVHTLDDLPRDDFELFFGGQPLMDPAPELRIEEGRRLKDGERFYTATLPGWFEHVDLGVWMFRIEILVVFGLLLLLLGAFIGRKTLGSIRARKIEQAAQQPQIIYAFPPGMLAGPTPQTFGVTPMPATQLS